MEEMRECLKTATKIAIFVQFAKLELINPSYSSCSSSSRSS